MVGDLAIDPRTVRAHLTPALASSSINACAPHPIERLASGNGCDRSLAHDSSAHNLAGLWPLWTSSTRLLARIALVDALSERSQPMASVEGVDSFWG